jgi:hypothetical protein
MDLNTLPAVKKINRDVTTKSLPNSFLAQDFLRRKKQLNSGFRFKSTSEILRSKSILQPNLNKNALFPSHAQPNLYRKVSPSRPELQTTGQNRELGRLSVFSRPTRPN